MRNINSLLFFAVVVLAGCSKADISFVSHAEMPEVNKTAALKWSIALSRDDIVKVRNLQEVDYNTPLASENALSKMLILDWAGTGEEKSVEITPGVYDWLIVMDSNGDGKVDSYLGTLASDIKLKQYEFAGGLHYRIVVHEDESVELTVQ